MAPKKWKAIAATALVATGKGKGNNVGIKKNTKLPPTTEFDYDDDDDDDSNETPYDYTMVNKVPKTTVGTVDTHDDRTPYTLELDKENCSLTTSTMSTLFNRNSVESMKEWIQVLEAQLLKSKRLNRYGIEQLLLMPGWKGKINIVVQKENFSTFKFLSKKTIQDVPQIAEQCFQAVMPNMSEMEQKQYFKKALKSCLYRALLEQRADVQKR